MYGTSRRKMLFLKRVLWQWWSVSFKFLTVEITFNVCCCVLLQPVEDEFSHHSNVYDQILVEIKSRSQNFTVTMTIILLFFVLHIVYRTLKFQIIVPLRLLIFGFFVGPPNALFLFGSPCLLIFQILFCRYYGGR